MKSKEEIETLLEGLGKTWPGDGSIVEGVMRIYRIRADSPKIVQANENHDEIRNRHCRFRGDFRGDLVGRH